MITSSFEIITPEKAREYLTKNTRNYRFVNRAKVAAYADDMKKGLWETNGESIVFGADGTLKDGQHRLTAILASGKSIMSLVVRGVDDKVNMYDSGMTRTSAQTARADGYPATNDMLGAVRVLFGGWNNTTGKATLNAYLKAHYDELRQAAHIIRYGNTHGPGRRASCCLMVYCIRRLNLMSEDMLNEFFYIFNQQSTPPNQMQDPSPALIAARTFMLKLSSGSGNAQKKQFSLLYQALMDYKKNKHRQKEYLTETETASFALLDQIREMDGINEKA